MARAVKKLSVRTVAAITEPGRHSDGDGLYLVVDPGGARRWLFMFRWQGRLKEMGLGGFSRVSLAEARELAAAARRQVHSGTNPIEARRVAKAEEKTVQADRTFGAFADDLVESIKVGFRNEKHRWQWSHTLKTYAAALYPLDIDTIETRHVLDVLRPLWSTKQETAARLRGRIERVLDAAKANGLRSGDNPARWRGHLDQLLPRRQKLQRGHHRALAFEKMPEFIAELRKRAAVSALALEFTILGASRSGEVIGAKWTEIDRASKIWTVPPERMKGNKEHRVPLTARMLAILDEIEKVKTSEYVFPGGRKDKPLSNMAMSMLLRDRMKRTDITVHGFRSSFRDWVGEKTQFSWDVAEAALAHIVGNETARAYRRGDALEKRRELMQAWEKFLTIPASSHLASMGSAAA